MPLRVDPHQIDLHPVARGGRLQRLEVVAGAADGPDEALRLEIAKHVHGTLHGLGPLRISDAVQEDDVEVVRAELAQEALDVGANLVGRATHRLGGYGHRLASDLPQRRSHVRMGAVHVGRVPEADAVLVGEAQQVGKALDAEVALVGAMLPARSARSEAEARGRYTGQTQVDDVHAFSSQSFWFVALAVSW